jgi:serine/threonine-protein kinase
VKRTNSDSSSDDDVPAPRSSRTREESVGQDTEKAAPIERAERAAPAAAAPTSGIGILRLNSRPWSQVFVDGKLIGNTPQMGLRLSAGSHEIALANQQLGMSKKIRVDIVADEITTRVVTLEE